MITASTFCRSYSSVWNDLIPTAELFVRKINLGYSREFPEMTAETRPMRRGFINELAFDLFSRDVVLGKRWSSSAISTQDIHAAATSFAPNGSAGLLADEVEDVREQHQRMMRVFAFEGQKLVAEPAFLGCGIRDSCKGDLLVDDTLYEIKAGERFFRSVDIRQLITYAALNDISKQFSVQRCGLFNPRIGVSLVIGVDELCLEVSGKKCADLFAEVIRAISSGEISR